MIKPFGVSISKPENHIIKFYLGNELLQKVEEPISVTHLFIPMRGDRIKIDHQIYDVINSEITYLPLNIVAEVILKVVDY